MADALHIEFIVRRDFGNDARGELEKSSPGLGVSTGRLFSQSNRRPIMELARRAGFRAQPMV